MLFGLSMVSFVQTAVTFQLHIRDSPGIHLTLNVAVATTRVRTSDERIDR